MKKIGLLVMALILALGALGVGYAKWTDTVTINGTVNSGNVDIVITGYSGTWVFKDKSTGLVLIAATPTQRDAYAADSDNILIASATAAQTLNGTTPVDDAVTMTFTNLFPLLPATDRPYCTDVEGTYAGSIPALFYLDLSSSDIWLERLWVDGYVTLSFTVNGSPIPPFGPVQLHKNDTFRANMCINIPEGADYPQADFSGKQGSFIGHIVAVQWNEPLP
jgi:predicted ribosomally synthesized peptide with SipW-like signal peptide